MPTIPARRFVLDIPWSTLIRLGIVAAAAWVTLQLLNTILVLIVALLIAVTLDPAVDWLERRRLRRATAATVVCLVVLLLVGGFVWLTWASLVQQSAMVGRRLAEVYGDLMTRLPQSWVDAASSSTGEALSTVGSYLVSVAASAGSAVAILVLAFVLAYYLLIDGVRIYNWFVAFVPLRHRPRVETMLAHGRRVLFGYMVGNVLTSIVAAVVTFVALFLLGVPAALFLALAAGLSDFVPVVGFFVSLVPALVLAFAVSAKTALAVVVIYVAYNTVENYLLSPWAYGGRMKLSDFAVIIAFVVGAELAGVIGAVIALPLAALYPTFERLWLRGQLPDETVRDHQAIERS